MIATGRFRWFPAVAVGRRCRDKLPGGMVAETAIFRK